MDRRRHYNMFGGKDENDRTASLEHVSRVYESCFHPSQHQVKRATASSNREVQRHTAPNADAVQGRRPSASPDPEAEPQWTGLLRWQYANQAARGSLLYGN